MSIKFLSVIFLLSSNCLLQALYSDSRQVPLVSLEEISSVDCTVFENTNMEFARLIEEKAVASKKSYTESLFNSWDRLSDQKIENKLQELNDVHAELFKVLSIRSEMALEFKQEDKMIREQLNEITNLVQRKQVVTYLCCQWVQDRIPTQDEVNKRRQRLRRVLESRLTEVYKAKYEYKKILLDANRLLKNDGLSFQELRKIRYSLYDIASCNKEEYPLIKIVLEQVREALKDYRFSIYSSKKQINEQRLVLSALVSTKLQQIGEQVESNLCRIEDQEILRFNQNDIEPTAPPLAQAISIPCLQIINYDSNITKNLKNKDA